jgi:arabinan endo-1,5-alpha-L-arabinosidase
VKLNDNRKEISEPQEWYTVSKRPRAFNVGDVDPGPGAVEAPFIFKKDGYYYLFVSFDFCCRGKESTYKVVVGRSEKIQGPYLDKAGVRMDNNGGTLVREGNDKWAGVGHNSVYHFDGKDFLIYHGYDIADGGKPKLIVNELKWDSSGWPVVETP